MGLYDKLACALPGFDSTKVYQTKSFKKPAMDSYKITEDGTLMKLEWRKVFFTGEVKFGEHEASFKRGDITGCR